MKFNDVGSSVLANDTLGTGQYYTQINDTVYMISPSGDQFNIYNLQNKQFINNWNDIVINTNVANKACIASNSNYIFVVGGGENGGVLNDFQALDLLANAWVQNTSPLNKGRYAHSCVVHEEVGYLYAIGGYGTGGQRTGYTVEKTNVSVTNISNSNWTQLPLELLEGTAGTRSIIYKSTIWILTGYWWNKYHDTIQILNVTNDQISWGPTMQNAVENSSPINVHDYIMYVFGGKTWPCCSTFVTTWQYIWFNASALTTSIPPSNPTTSNPTTSIPSTSNPSTPNPTISNSTISNSTTSNPTISNSTTSNPTISIPTASNPTTSIPTVSIPTTSIPSTSIPTISPTMFTQNKTTKNPTVTEASSDSRVTVIATDEFSKLPDENIATIFEQLWVWALILTICLASVLLIIFYRRKSVKIRTKMSEMTNKINSKSILIENPMCLLLGVGNYDESVPEAEFEGYVDDLEVDIDIHNLSNLFKNKLNYHVLPKYKQFPKLFWTRDEIIQFLQQKAEHFANNVISNKENKAKQNYDGLIAVISGHGIEDQLITSDYKLITKNVIHRIFSSYYPASREVPRIFIYDSCDGDEQRKGVQKKQKIKPANIIAKPFAINDIQHPDSNEQHVLWQRYTENPDFKLVTIHSTNKGFQSKMNSQDGSYLIKKFVDKTIDSLNKTVQKRSFLYEICDEIQQELCQTKQLPIFTFNNNTRFIKFVVNQQNKDESNNHIISTIELTQT
eukprot:455232_1